MYSLYAYVPFLATFAGWMGIQLGQATKEPYQPRALVAGLAIMVAIFAWAVSAKPLLFYAALENDPDMTLLRVVLAVAAVCTLGIVYLCLTRPLIDGGDERAQRIATALAIAAVVLLYVARYQVLQVSPFPLIDTFTSCTLGADHLLAGRNPYLQIYPDIYHGRYDTIPGCNYWPGIYLWIVPARAIGGDIRWAFLVADLIFVVALGRIAKKVGLPRPAPLLIMLAWAAFPPGLFELEQAWNDIILLAMFACAVWALLEERVVYAGIALGVAASIKLTALPVCVPVLLYVIINHGWKKGAKLVAGALGAFVVVVTAFVAGDVPGFFRLTVAAKLVRAQPRPDALSIPALIMQQFDLVPYNAFFLIASVGMTALFALLVWRKRARTLPDVLFPLVVYYAGMFMLGKVAFCNYYFFISGLLILLAVTSARVLVSADGLDR
jgi:hypothetical protein